MNYIENKIKRKLIQLFFLLIVTSGCKNKVDNIQERIQGVWVISKAEINPFELPDNCTINIGDTFEFNDNKLLIKKNGINNKCSFNGYYIKDSILTINKLDFNFNMKIENVNNDELILSMRFLPKKMMADWKKDYIKFKKHGFEIYLKR